MAEIPEFRRILILGAGVVGSVYAARLKAAGVDAAVLARGRRLADVSEHGIVLDESDNQETHRLPHRLSR